MKRKHVTEIIVETVAIRTVADAAVEQETVGLAANKVSPDSEFISRKNVKTN